MDTIDDPVNDNAPALEELMLLATLDAGAAEAFYDALLEADVFVPGVVTGEGPDGSDLELHFWQHEDDDDAYIPVFTSAELLEDAAGDDNVPYLSFVMRDLLSVIEGSTVILNPASEISLELDPDDIQGLLDRE